MIRATLLLSLSLLTSACWGGPHYTQVWTGFNGPNIPKTEYFLDANSARSSWLSKALGSTQLETLLSQISFDTQMLMVSAVGERENITGTLKIQDVNQDEDSLTVFLLIGVNGPGCTYPHALSYPFVVAIVDRPTRFDGLGSYYHQNFPDGCKPAKTGKPNDGAAP